LFSISGSFCQGCPILYSFIEAPRLVVLTVEFKFVPHEAREPLYKKSTAIAPVFPF